MILQFVAKKDLLVTVPGQSIRVGHAVRYVGRQFEPVPGGGAKYPATEAPFCIDAHSESGRRLAKLIKRDASLYAYDQATAAHCGVPFVALKFEAGEWSPE